MKKLYFNGSILTMDKAAPRAEAVLTEDGVILAVGSREALLTPDAEPVDLHGKTLMPGFVDGHGHMISVGINLRKNCNLVGCTGFDDMLDFNRRMTEHMARQILKDENKELTFFKE